MAHPVPHLLACQSSGWVLEVINLCAKASFFGHQVFSSFAYGAHPFVTLPTLHPTCGGMSRNLSMLHVGVSLPAGPLARCSTVYTSKHYHTHYHQQTATYHCTHLHTICMPCAKAGLETSTQTCLAYHVFILVFDGHILLLEWSQLLPDPCSRRDNVRLARALMQ